MAGVRGEITTAQIATGTALKTIVQLRAATNRRVHVHEWRISFKGNSPTATPILVEVLRQSTDGTMSANTPVKSVENDAEALQTTAGENATVEPTAGDVLHTQLVHPVSSYTWPAPFDKPIVVEGDGNLGIRVTAPADVNCVAGFSFEE